jgi:hypothetical protein
MKDEKRLPHGMTSTLLISFFIGKIADPGRTFADDFLHHLSPHEKIPPTHA